VITCGGESDFAALGLEMADFDYFDLQSHFYLETVNEQGEIKRQPHSLRSLAASDLFKSPQNVSVASYLISCYQIIGSLVTYYAYYLFGGEIRFNFIQNLNQLFFYIVSCLRFST